MVSIPQFCEDFGSYFRGDYILDTTWQAVFSCIPHYLHDGKEKISNWIKCVLRFVPIQKVGTAAVLLMFGLSCTILEPVHKKIIQSLYIRPFIYTLDPNNYQYRQPTIQALHTCTLLNKQNNPASTAASPQAAHRRAFHPLQRDNSPDQLSSLASCH